MDSCKLHNVNEVYYGIETSESIARELSEYFTFYVPGYKFMPSYKMKVWDGKIRLFDLRKHTLYKGLLNYIIKFCYEREYKLEYDKEVFDISVDDITTYVNECNLTITPRDYQLEAVRHCIGANRTLLLAPTGSGKSLIIYLLIRYYELRTLLIVPTVSLTKQMFTDFDSYDPTWNVADKCHIIIQGKEKKSDKQVIISTWQSIYKLPSSYFNTFGVVVGDEAHLYKAKSLTSILNKMTDTKYRFGTTGTLDDAQTHQLVLEGMFGPLFRTTTTKDLMDADYLAQFSIKALVLKYDEETSKSIKDMKYQEELDFIVNHEKRNNFIKNLAIDQHGNTLLLFQFVEKHGRVLYDLIRAKADDNRKVFFVHGGVDGDEREEIRRITEQEADAIIVASYGTFSTGINIRNLHNIIFASPSKSKIRNLQSIGRGLRKGNKKDKATLFDIADDLRYKSNTNYTLDHFNERIKQYNEQEFTYSIFTIQLK
jgi:superfamily II DNA or RNA helicase